MERLVGALVSFLAERGDVFVYLATALAVVGRLTMPVEVRRRLGSALVFAALFVLLRLIASGLPSGGAELGAIAVGFGGLCIARVGFVFAVDVVVERRGTRPMNALVRDVIQAGVYIVVVLVVLRMMDLQPTSLLATGTVLTAVLGLSLQETLGHLFAGIAVQIERPVRVGDWIVMDKIDYTGRVIAMNWRSVTIQGDDRGQLVVPNGVFARTPFFNYTKSGLPIRRHLYFTLPYDVLPQRAHEAILAACRECPDVLADPAPSVFTWRTNDKGVEYWLRFFVDEYAVRDPAQSAVMTRLLYELKRRKLALALPIANQYLHYVDESAAARELEEATRDRRAALDSVDFLHPLSEAAKADLARRAHRKLYAPGEVLLHKGDAARSFYVVRRGEVAVRVDGREMRRLAEGEFFGELALLTGSERSADVVATRESEVLEIDDAMFRDVLKAEPAVAAAVSEIVARRRAELEALTEKGNPSRADQRNVADEILQGIRKVFGLGE